MAPRALYNPFLVARQTLFCFLLLYISLHFLEFYVNGLLCVASYAQQNYVEIRPCCSVCRIVPYFLLISNIPFYECTTVYLSIHLLMDVWVVSEFGFPNKAALNVRVQVFVWMYTFIPLW